MRYTKFFDRKPKTLGNPTVENISRFSNFSRGATSDPQTPGASDAKASSRPQYREDAKAGVNIDLHSPQPPRIGAADSGLGGWTPAKVAKPAKVGLDCGVADHPLVAAVIGRFPGAQITVLRRNPALTEAPSANSNFAAELTAALGNPPHAAAFLANRLGHHPRGHVSQSRWTQFVTDAGREIREGTVVGALSMGWRLEELLGVHRLAPWARLDFMGLLLLLGGSHIADMNQTSAFIETPSGARQAFTRRLGGVGDTVFIWDID